MFSIFFFLVDPDMVWCGLEAIVETLFIKGLKEEGRGVQLLWKPRCTAAGCSVVVIGSISMCGSVCMCTCLYGGYSMYQNSGNSHNEERIHIWDSHRWVLGVCAFLVV